MTKKAVRKRAPEQVPAPVVPITPMQMLEIAVQQGADLDKLKQLMDLNDRYEAAQAKKAYNVAMSAFRAECPIIDRTREGHNSKYAGLAEALEQIKELISRNGLSHGWKTNQEIGYVTVECTVTHVDGHQESTSLTAEPDLSGNKNSIQAIGSSVSYLQRYTLFAILGLAAKDQDDDGGAAASTPAAPPAETGGPLKKTDLKLQAHKLRTALLGSPATAELGCQTTHELDVVTETYKDVIAQLIGDLPSWYYGTKEIEGLKQTIDRLYRELPQED